MTDRVTSTNTIPCLQLHIKNSCMCLSEFMTLSRVHDITNGRKSEKRRKEERGRNEKIIGARICTSSEVSTGRVQENNF